MNGMITQEQADRIVARDWMYFIDNYDLDRFRGRHQDTIYVTRYFWVIVKDDANGKADRTGKSGAYGYFEDFGFTDDDEGLDFSLVTFEGKKCLKIEENGKVAWHKPNKIILYLIA